MKTTDETNLPAVRVAAVQMEPKLGQIEANLERILDRIAHAANAGARLVVFPECASQVTASARAKRVWRTPFQSRARLLIA